MFDAGPLKGARIIDLTTVLMGPYASQILAELGGDVIKVESSGGDPVRSLGPAHHEEMGALFLQANRGKRSIVLDPKMQAGREVLLRLASSADILITNFRPQALRRLNLDHETLAAQNPRLILATLSGYGANGPYSEQPAYDDLIQGAVGLPSLMLTAGAQTPRYVPLALADRVAGLWAVIAVLAAMLDRSETGIGKHIDLSMFETMAHFVLGDHLGGRVFDPPLGTTGYARLLSRDRRPYPTRDGYVCAVIHNDGQWERFFEAIGRSDRFHEDPRFRTLATRTKHIDEIYAIVAEQIAQRTTEDCIQLLKTADIPVMPLNTIDTLIDDPQLAASGFFQRVEHPTEGSLIMPALPLRFDDERLSATGSAPRLGQHTREILGEIGMNAAEIASLFAKGAVQEPPRETAMEAGQ